MQSHEVQIGIQIQTRQREWAGGGGHLGTTCRVHHKHRGHTKKYIRASVGAAPQPKVPRFSTGWEGTAPVQIVSLASSWVGDPVTHDSTVNWASLSLAALGSAGWP